MRERRLLLLSFGLGSLIAVTVGCVVAAGAGVPVGVWGRNLAAWLVGAIVAIALVRAGISGRFAAVVALGGIVLLVASFVEPGLEGVHRWIVAGPVRINAAAMLLPIMIVALAQVAWAPVAMLAITVMLVAQPDASQATGFAAAAIILLVGRPRVPLTLAAAGVLAAMAGFAWMRPDPLAPVAEVEGIVGLAWGQSPLLALTALAGLALAAGAPSLVRSTPARSAGLALAAYMIVTAAAPEVGAFPVPLIGMSMSPIIGFWLGIGALAALTARQ